MPAEHADHGEFSDDDLWTFFCVIAVVLICLVVIFDTVAHSVTHRLHHEVHEHRHMVISAYRDKMQYLLWSSLQGELMVLGFLAFAIWLCNQLHMFDFLANKFEQEVPHEPAAAGGPPALGVVWRAPCSRRTLPGDAHELLELVEHAHMVLFIAMVLYFLFLAVVLSVLLRKFRLYELQEFRASHGQAPAGVLEQRAARQVAASRAYLLRRVQVMFEEELAQRPAVKDTVERGVLDYTAFLEVTTQELIERFVEFPLPTWLLVCLYFGLLAAGGELLCFSMEFSFSIILDGCYAWSTLYMAARLLVFRRRVSHGASSGRTAWPLQVLDRITSPIVGPGITGFYPWSTEPSEVAALCCTQAMLFFQVVWMSYMMCPNPLTQRMLSLSNLPGGMLVQVFVRLSCLALWALFILPKQLEVFALPPFITDEEAEDLFRVLEMNPTGAGCAPAADSPQHSDSFNLVMARRATRLRRTVPRGSTVDRLLAVDGLLADGGGERH